MPSTTLTSRLGAPLVGRHILCFAAIAAVSPRLGCAADRSACRGLMYLESIHQVHSCAEGLLEAATPDQAKGLQKALGAAREVREMCGGTGEKGTSWGCKALSDLAYELLAEGTALLHVCRGDPGRACDDRGRAAAQAVVAAWEHTEVRYRNTPEEIMVTDRLAALRGERLLGPLESDDRMGEGAEALPPAWQTALRAVDKLKHWVSGYIWRETQWLWLMDSLAAGRVVQTAWGDADEWLKFGVHDAHSQEPLGRPAPRYLFSDRSGMRWDIMVWLLRELRDRRGLEQGQKLSVVEIGVFAGHLSQFMLRDCDFIELLGVDPYIGSDGTFPGNFSKTLDANAALYKAASVIEPYHDRAYLWQVTSEDAAAQLENGTIDAVFIDGCHLYDCVRRDFDLWLPKMRRGVETLVAGHDFSPQWPGVVRAVHEERLGGLDVHLASDWMYWWFERYHP